MMGEVSSCLYTVWGICFEAARSSAQGSIFGIAEFLTTVAIFSVAYNVSDRIYKFRVGISAWPFMGVFSFTALISACILIANSLWFELELPIPRFVNSPLIVEAVVAIVMIAILAAWFYIAYLKPPRFSRRNAARFAKQVFIGIASGDALDLAAVSNEVGMSASEIVASARWRVKERDRKRGGIALVKPEVARIADEVLSLLGDRRFCRHVAKKAPWVAQVLFSEVGNAGLSDLRFVQFARNVSLELLADSDSAIHHEDEWFRSGLIGELKPVSVSVFGNSELIDQLAGRGGSPLDLVWQDLQVWGRKSWDAYNRASLLYLSDRLKRGDICANTATYGLFRGYERIAIGLHRINDLSDGYHQSIEFYRLEKGIEFVNRVLQQLEESDVTAPKKAILRDGRVVHSDIFDLLSNVAFELIFAAGSVKTADFRSWEVQHNTVWAPLIGYSKSGVRTIFLSRLMRLIWKEVRRMETYPNYKGARIILVCLNVLGLSRERSFEAPEVVGALKRAMLNWVRLNYLKIHGEYPSVALACTGASVSFDAEKKELIKTYSSLRGKEPHREILKL
jgi:hypothetical protein